MECQRNSNYVRLRKKSCVESRESQFFIFSLVTLFPCQTTRLISFLISNSIFLFPITSKAFHQNTSYLFTFVVLCIVSTIASLVLVEKSPCHPSPRSLRSCPTILESVQELLQRPGIDVGLESAQHEINHGVIIFFMELLSILQRNIMQCVRNLGVTRVGLL
uniref:Uncharacterized protein n=1 Tax=Setaria viridis TaxID=4556 RepID=A0A4U6U287_SETVI|nr:hypothetical protein SEVIR_6G116600v2 [Setaria viridis]